MRPGRDPELQKGSPPALPSDCRQRYCSPLFFGLVTGAPQNAITVFHECCAAIVGIVTA
jgi:hypothetical protein